MRLSKLDWRLLLLGEHCYLDTADECYFTDMYECSHRQGLKPQILALKQQRKSAIVHFAQQLTMALPNDWATSYTFVAIPPSTGTISGINSVVNRLSVSNVSNLLVQKRDTPPSRDGWRLSPIQRADLMMVNELAVDRQPDGVVAVDDVLTTGSHYRAAKMVLRSRWPDLRVIGLFLARVCSHYKQCSPTGICKKDRGFGRYISALPKCLEDPGVPLGREVRSGH